MAIQKTTSTGLAAEVRVIYDRNLLSRLLPTLGWTLFGQSKPMPKNEGQSVQFRRFSSLPLATTPLVEGVTPNSTDLTVTTLTATPAQYGDFVEVSDLLDMTAPDPIILETGTLQGEQAGQTIETVVRDQILLGTTIQYAAARVSRVTVAVGDKLTGAEIHKAVRTLKRNNAPKIMQMINPSTGVGSIPVNSTFVGIVDADTEYDLKNDPEWKSVETYAAGAGQLLPGEIGKIDEVRFMAVSLSKVYTGLGAGGIDVHGTLILGAGAFGVIAPTGIQTFVKPLGSSGTADPLDQRSTIGWKTYFVAVILQQLAMVRIEHATTA